MSAFTLSGLCWMECETWHACIQRTHLVDPVTGLRDVLDLQIRHKALEAVVQLLAERVVLLALCSNELVCHAAHARCIPK